MDGINVWQLIILLVILMLLFGTKKIRNIGGDLGHAVKSFKNALAGKSQLEKTEADITTPETEKMSTEE